MSLVRAIMPITLLWAVDVYGRVYSLSTAGQRWERADDLLLELKRVTSGKGAAGASAATIMFTST
ncbi:hypothetical protein INR49_011143 [Caranx melampygus]|nr:hypothetical protein INR49_011143 [Caranx melampygus]